MKKKGRRRETEEGEGEGEGELIKGCNNRGGSIDEKLSDARIYSEKMFKFNTLCCYQRGIIMFVK